MTKVDKFLRICYRRNSATEKEIPHVTDKSSPFAIGPYRLLSLLFASLPSDREYPSDHGRWTEAVWNLFQRHEKEHPELFVELTFSRKPGCHPYSRQVSVALISGRGDLFEVRIGPTTPYVILPEAQAQKREHNEARVSPTILPLIAQLAREMSEDPVLQLPVPV